jgi:hypothetical protein
MNPEPRFLLESLSRWDFGWRLSQTDGPILLPVPQDFHTTVEAFHHVKRISNRSGCTLVVRGPDHRAASGDGPPRIVEIHAPARSLGAERPL